MSSTPVRRSARIAAKQASIQQQNVATEVEKLFMMLKEAEQNNINNVPLSEKIIHIIKIFEFILDPSLRNIVTRSEVFRLSIKNRIYNVTESLKYMTLPYWIAVKFTDVSRNLMEYVLDIEKTLA